MALSKGSVNPLNVLGFRKLNWIPEHFAKISVKSAEIDNMSSWIYNNLNGRYAVARSLKIDENNKMIETQNLGFEDPAELTMFSLACPYLHK